MTANQQSLNSYFFNPNMLCPNHNIPCAICKIEYCAPCNQCSKREGYWTLNEQGQHVEVKCQEPCRIYTHWKKLVLHA